MEVVVLQRTCKMIPWQKACDKAVDVATKYYPERNVPRWGETIDNRDAWRMFTAPTDDGTSWNKDQRRTFFDLHRTR